MQIATRNHNQTPLSDAHIMAVAPSVFANEAHGSRSEKYTYIPTIDILNGLRKNGFEVFEAKQSRVKDQSKRDFTTHVLKLRHADSVISLNQYGQPGERVEIILRNSHDGASSFEVSQGVYRLVCSNGMVSSRTNATIRIPHRGDIIGNVIEGAYEIVEDSKALAGVVQDWKAIQLAPGEQLALASAAMQLRFDEEAIAEGREQWVVSQLNKVRRWEDKGNDLWNTFNRVQENVIKGGIALGRNENGRRRTSRAVTGVDQDLKLNKALWTLADQMARIKTGEALAA